MSTCPTTSLRYHAPCRSPHPTPGFSFLPGPLDSYHLSFIICLFAYYLPAPAFMQALCYTPSTHQNGPQLVQLKWTPNKCVWNEIFVEGLSVSRSCYFPYCLCLDTLAQHPGALIEFQGLSRPDSPASSCLSAWTGSSLLIKGWTPRASWQEGNQRVFNLGVGLGCTVRLVPSLLLAPTFPKSFLSPFHRWEN